MEPQGLAKSYPRIAENVADNFAEKDAKHNSMSHINMELCI